MAISLVGTGTFIRSTGNGNATTLTFSTGAAASGDLVIAWWVHTRGALTSQLVSSAGTAYGTMVETSTGNLGIRAGYRILTSAETTVTSCATGSAQDSVVLAAIVLRGVNSGPIIDPNQATGNSSQPNSPSRTVAGPHDAVITTAAILSNTTLTAPSGYGAAVSTGATDTRSCAGGLAWVSTSGPATVDPGPWAAGAAAAWIALTATIRSTEPIVFTWSKMDMSTDTIPRMWDTAIVSY